ncbi:MAG: hypothetical protein CME06_00945 [Gemmatimonadetes bacterium]|nr:hypothetical protein [Gemmatimonadota bacterium]
MREPIVRFLERGRRAERRDLRDLHLKPVEERVADGSAIAGLRRIEQRGDAAVYRIPGTATKLRPGDACWLSSGAEITSGRPVEIEEIDLGAGVLVLRPDRFADASGPPPEGGVLDRRNLDLTDHLVRGLEPIFDDERGRLAGADWVRRAVEGEAELGPRNDRLARAKEAVEADALTESQREAFSAAVAARELALVQGPPGTGKTRVAAAVVLEALRHGEKVLVSALTHRAINNVLAAVATLGEKSRGHRVFKIGRPHQGAELRALGIESRTRLQKGAVLPGEGMVVGATTFGAVKLRRDYSPFDLVLLDEAGQVPIPHAMSAFAGGLRGVVVGDHRQLGPVVAGGGTGDPMERSIFEHLAERYRGRIHLLRESWRMNAGICRFSSRFFYEDAVVPHKSAADRRLQLDEGGQYRAILDPEKASVWVAVDHLARRNHSREEARVVAALVRELVSHHGVPPAEIAVVSPFRAHAGAVSHELARAIPEAAGALIEGLVVDTAERIQGQEREVVLYTFGSSDRDYLSRNAEFLFDPGRLNVALTRARTKRIIIGSPEVARARPRKLEALRRAALVQALWSEHIPIEQATPECDTIRVRWEE